MSLTITTSVQQQQQHHKKPTMPTTTEPDEAVVHPDSTTPLDKERPAFGHGQDVLLKHKDGRYYLGTVVEVDTIREQCLVKFGDNTESWSSFKDLTKLSVPDEDLLCVVCKKSGDKFEVKVCDKCGRGYHMKCHQPEIPAECQKEGATWMCKKCVDCFQGRNKSTNDKSILRKENIRKLCSGVESCITPPTDRSKLPYDPDLLNWDTYHRVNIEQIYCYCGRNGEWYTQMLQCGRCRQWFHEKCVRCLKFPLYCGDRFYVFVCSICNNGKEFVRRLELKWVDMVHLMLFNLTAFNVKKYYDLDTVIIPYVNDNWHALQLPPKIYSVSKQERRENILSVLTNNRNRFKCGREIKKRTTIWGLRVRLPPPAPCVTLPSTGTITEEGLRERWEGNRRLQFLSVPPEDDKPNLNIESIHSNEICNTIVIKQEIKQEIEDDDDEDVKIIPSELTMLGIMRGTRYQNNQTFSETESPCSSPIPPIAQLGDVNDDDDDDDGDDDDDDDDDALDHDDDDDDEDDDDDDDDDDEDYNDDKSITENNLKLYKMDYHGGGFVKKSVPFPKISKQRRKHLLSLNKRDRDKILRRQKQNQRKNVVKSEPQQQTKSVKDAKFRKTRRLNLKPVLTDKEEKKQEESNLPLTPPTSVSAPPTPPASSTPLQSALSNEIASDYSLNSVDLAQNLNNLNKSTKPSIKSDLNSLELNTPCSSGDDETSSKSTLDLIIPPPKDFEGKNNPFHALLKGAGSTQPAPVQKQRTSITLPLPLTAVIPSAPVARPAKRQLSEKDICIGPNGEVKRRRLRRNRTQSQISSYNPGQPTASKTAAVVPARPDGKEWTQRSLRSSLQGQNANANSAAQQSQNQNQQTQIGNCVDYALNGRRLRQRQDAASKSSQDSAASKTANNKIQTVPTKTSPIKQEPDINMDDLKSSVNIYFGAANRIASGERFGVKAKRIGPCGKIQYLIEWEGPSQGMT